MRRVIRNALRSILFILIWHCSVALVFAQQTTVRRTPFEVNYFRDQDSGRVHTNQAYNASEDELAYCVEGRERGPDAIRYTASGSMIYKTQAYTDGIRRIIAGGYYASGMDTGWSAHVANADQARSATAAAIHMWEYDQFGDSSYKPGNIVAADHAYQHVVDYAYVLLGLARGQKEPALFSLQAGPAAGWRVDGTEWRTDLPIRVSGYAGWRIDSLPSGIAADLPIGQPLATDCKTIRLHVTDISAYTHSDRAIRISGLGGAAIEDLMFYHPSESSDAIFQDVVVMRLSTGSQDVGLPDLPSSLQVVKTGEGGKPLAGVEFRLSSGAIHRDGRTNADGLLAMDQLTAGTYRLTETGVPAGYRPSEPRTVELAEGQTLRLTISNQLRQGRLRIRKTSEDNRMIGQVRIRVSGTAFDREFLTDETGHILVEGLIPGVYTVQEVRAPAGYWAPEPEQVDVRDAETADVTVHNRLTRLTLGKSDLTNGTPVAGAHIRITRAEDDDPVFNGITDSAGKIEVVGLPAGSYRFFETVCPEGYILNPEPAAFRILENGTVDGDTVLLDEPTELRIDKRLTGSELRLAGARFRLCPEGSDRPIRFRKVGGIYIASADGAERELISVASGPMIVRYLPQGAYTWVETAAPAGYAAAPEAGRFELGATHGVSQPLILRLDNRRLVELSKTDQDSGQPLAGAVFRVTDKSTGMAVFEGATDTDGKRILPGLAAGQYQWQEIRSPQGYARQTEILSFQVDTTGRIVGDTRLGNARTELRIAKTVRGGPIGIAGVSFRLYRAETGESMCFRFENGFYAARDDGDLDRLLTDRHGLVCVRGLPVGSYKLQETGAPPGFDVTPEHRTIVLTDRHGPQDPLVVHWKDTVQAQFQKCDRESKQPLAGSLWLLLDEHAENILRRARSDDNGMVRFTGLEAGRYLAEEVEAPPGYDRIAGRMPVCVRPDGRVEAEPIVYNDRTVRGRIRVLKREAGSGMVMAGVTFEIFDAFGALAGTMTTDSDGVALSEILPEGDYRIRELPSADWPHHLPAPEFSTSVDRRPTPGQQAVVYETLLENRKMARLILMKKDRDQNLPLAGALFEIQGALSDAPPIRLASDEQGRVEVWLAGGAYSITETQPPPGYTADRMPLDIVVDWGEERQIDWLNNRPTVPQTGEKQGLPLLPIGASLLVCVAGLRWRCRGRGGRYLRGDRRPRRDGVS